MRHKYRMLMMTLIIGFSFVLTTPLLAGEHPGEEHGGEPVKKEHAGTKATTFTAAQIKKTMKEHIDNATTKGGGTFNLTDKDDGNKKLKLKFVKIHDPVRKIEGKGYFACTDFQLVDDPKQVYDLDFWLNPKDGKLVVTATKVHKVPELKEGSWVKKARYTFVNDKPVVIK